MHGNLWQIGYLWTIQGKKKTDKVRPNQSVTGSKNWWHNVKNMTGEQTSSNSLAADMISIYNKLRSIRPRQFW